MSTSSDPVLYRDEFGHALLRRGVVAAFFVRRPISEVAQVFQKAFQEWLDFVPAEAKGWCLVGNAEEGKPFNKAGVSRCMGQLDAEKAAKRDGYFTVTGPEETAPEYGCMFSLKSRVDGTTPRCHCIELTLPLRFAEPPGTEELVALVTRLSLQLRVDSAYASLALIFPNNLDLKGAGAMIAPLAMRHHGYDVPITDSVDGKIGGHARGAYWFTVLGQAQTQALGGIAAISGLGGPDITVAELGDGVSIRCGKQPQLGDTNRGELLPALRKLAQRIEPVTLFGDTFLDAYLGAQREAWERRFLDQ
jgi:TseV toxin immunity protein TsiV